MQHYFMGALTGFLTYSLLYASMEPYQKIWFTHNVSGLFLETLLLFVPLGISSLSATEGALYTGMAMSVALSATEMLYALVHRAFPSPQLKLVRAVYIKYDHCSFNEAITSCAVADALRDAKLNKAPS